MWKSYFLIFILSIVISSQYYASADKQGDSQLAQQAFTQCVTDCKSDDDCKKSCDIFKGPEGKGKDGDKNKKHDKNKRKRKHYERVEDDFGHHTKKQLKNMVDSFVSIFPHIDTYYKEPKKA